MVVCGDVWWFAVVCGGLQCFAMVCGGHTLFKERFWEGGGHKKEYAVYARENDDNYGRPAKKNMRKR